MAGRVPQFFHKLREWLWRSDAVAELRERAPSANEAEYENAESCLLIAWRTLAGLEPIASRTRNAVAAPLIVEAASACVRVAAPSRASFGELFDDADFRPCLVAAGIPEPELDRLQAWFLEPGSQQLGTLGPSALRAVRAVLAKSREPQRAIRRLLFRRVLLVGSAFISLLALAVVLFVVFGAERVDVAVGKRWRASSAYPGFSLEGTKPEKPVAGLFFSTNEEEQPWWRLDLRSRVVLDGANIVNRSDCCTERANPLVFEISNDGENWRELARRDEPFSTWSIEFKPTKTRFVRLRSLKRSNLHLKDVRLYSPDSD